MGGGTQNNSGPCTELLYGFRKLGIVWKLYIYFYVDTLTFISFLIHLLLHSIDGKKLLFNYIFVKNFL